MPSLNLRNPLRRDPNRPTLKQRAAALKATAARVMRRRTPASPPEIDAPLASAAPRLVALVAEWQDARRKLNDPNSPDGPEADAMGNRDAELQREIYLFPARTVADLVAKIPAFREEAEDALSGYAGQKPEETLPGAAWAGLLRDIEHLAGGSTREADAELIALGRQYDRLHAEWLVAEEANREPARRCAAAVKRAEHLEGDDYTAAMRLAWHLPGVDEAHQAKETAFEAIEPVAEAILALPASTPAGFAVKARVLIWGQWPGGQYGETDEEDLHNDYGRRCARLLIESACAAAGVDWRGEPVSGQALPSAAAPLADQILAGWREYGTDVGMNDEEASEHTQALGRRRYALIDAAEALPATRENVLAKALALAWLDYGEHWRSGQERDAYAVDGRLAFDIDTAICGRALTEY